MNNAFCLKHCSLSITILPIVRCFSLVRLRQAQADIVNVKAKSPSSFVFRHYLSSLTPHSC